MTLQEKIGRDNAKIFRKHDARVAITGIDAEKLDTANAIRMVAR